MSMGYGSNYADIISNDNVKAICQKEYDALIALLFLEDMTFDDFCQESGKLSDDILFAWGKLVGNFEYKTGLALETGYHSRDDDGDRYDEIDGGYFLVDGMYELTEAGKKIGDKVKRKFFVTFG